MLKKGFTLVELIVVIAIIGVLAAIIVPSIMGFVHEAKVKADVANAKRLYECIEQLMVEDSDAYNSMHKYNTTKYEVTANTSSGTETYRLVVVARLGGKEKIANTPSANVQHGNNEAQDFADALTEKLKRNVTGSSSKVLIPIKASKINNQNVNAWAICLRLEKNEKGWEVESDDVEIWTFDRNQPGAWKPNYRVYPNSCVEYENEK